MPQNLFTIGSIQRVHLQNKSQQIFTLRVEVSIMLANVFKSGAFELVVARTLFVQKTHEVRVSEFDVNIIEDFVGIFAAEQGVSDEQFGENAPEAPDVHGDVVLEVLQQDFGRFVVQGAYWC